MNQENDLQISTQEFINDSRERRKLGTSGKTKLKCDHCEWSTGSKTLLKRHLLNTHETKITETPKENTNNKKYISKRIKCEQCDKKFNKEATFTKHMESVHKKVNILLNKVTLPDKKRSLRNIKGRDTL